jgi:glucose/arabinose dehydrogenase
MKLRAMVIFAVFLGALGLVVILNRAPPAGPVTRLKLVSTELEVTVLLQNLEIPWDMSWSPDGWIWFSEKRGMISRYSPESGLLQQIHLIEDVFQSLDNSGLHALALHPDFPTVPFVYVHYTHSADESRLVRFRFNPSALILEEPTTLLDGLHAALSHNGSRIVFSPDGTKLFLSLGEAFQPQMAQDLNEYSGKILRMNLDGSVPGDNPFPGSLVWSYGHRNPQGLVYAGNGKLYSSEHGPANNDELNLVEKGRNYGWPTVRGYCDYPEEKRFCADHQVREPLWIWSPTIAVSGIEFYDHEAIPEWRGSILVTSLKRDSRKHYGQRLVQLRLDQGGEKVIEANDYLVNAFGRLREVMSSPDGRVFIFTSNRELNANRPALERPGDDKLIMLRNPDYPVIHPAIRQQP